MDSKSFTMKMFHPDAFSRKKNESVIPVPGAGEVDVDVLTLGLKEEEVPINTVAPVAKPAEVPKEGEKTEPKVGKSEVEVTAKEGETKPPVDKDAVKVTTAGDVDITSIVKAIAGSIEAGTKANESKKAEQDKAAKAVAEAKKDDEAKKAQEAKKRADEAKKRREEKMKKRAEEDADEEARKRKEAAMRSSMTPEEAKKHKEECDKEEAKRKEALAKKRADEDAEEEKRRKDEDISDQYPNRQWRQNMYARSELPQFKGKVKGPARKESVPMTKERLMVMGG